MISGAPIQYRRLLTLAVLLTSAFVGLGFRLYHLQIERHEISRELVEGATTLMLVKEPRRGDILDRRGNLLATSHFVKTVCADPSLIGTNQWLLARVLSPLLELPEADLAEKMRVRVWRSKDGNPHVDQHVVLKRKVPEERWGEIRGALTNLTFGFDEARLPRAQREYLSGLRARAIFADGIEDQMRVYPNGTLAAHVLGYVTTSERQTPHGRVMETVGLSGVEQRCDATLTGARGWRQVVTDRRRRELVSFREEDVPPRPGLNVVLTIDAGLQDIVETELASAVLKHTPQSATAIVIEPETGRVLALANWPTFHPAEPGRGNEGMEALRNRAVADVAEPGSTFKIVVVSAALNEGLVQLTDRIDCENGAFSYLGRTLHDSHRHGVLSLEEVIAKSSNIGAAKVGLRLGAARLHDYIRAFGFGDPTLVPLPGEVRGIVHPLDKWSKISPAWIPMGHEIAVTPLQMAMAMAAVANRGVLLRPWLVERVTDGEGRVVCQYGPQVVRRVVSEAVAAQMVRALTSAVTTNGTATAARMEHYVVAGKTGTAQKLVDGHYSNAHTYASFIGFFPAEQPELCISVVLDDPHNGTFGGETAAPVFRHIAERAAPYLSLPPSPVPGKLARSATFTAAEP